MSQQSVSLNDVFEAHEGAVLMSGVQALVRLAIEQMRLDRARGLHTGTFVSGYPGSPLGTVDMEFKRAERYTKPEGIVFKDGLNEELAASAVAGTQLLDQLPGALVDGVVGLWYGKNPGLDRAADAIRHGNFAGTMPLGGAVAIIGDDPASKSSTLPSSSAEMCESLMLPTLNPSTIAEIISYGLHAIAMSRASGAWTALRIVTDLADAAAVVDLVDPASVVGAPDAHREHFHATLLGAMAVEAERNLFEVRIPLANQYGIDHQLNHVSFEPSRARLGIMASGVTYASVLRAFEILGIDEAALEQMGVRLIKIGMIWPLDHEQFRGFVSGLETVFVVEDKRPFLELHIRDALYGGAHAPVILGKHDADGSELVPRWGSMDIDAIVALLAKVLSRLDVPEVVAVAMNKVSKPRRRIALNAVPVRQPYFCSGCPHNRSTQAGENELVGIGIGCHLMIAFQEEDRGHKIGITQMGGEGTSWIGLESFTSDDHFVQNLGDGTFFHSGSLAIRAAVAAGSHLTYKLLYNRAVSMTGGQDPVGQMEVPELTHWLALEGVTKIVVTTPEPKLYDRVRLDARAEVRHRDDLAQVSAELAATPGVTVIIHDDRCAAEERRLIKRGQLLDPGKRIFINSRVCEGCGDCQVKSTCMSVQPMATEYGDKTQIHQSSCNFDYSCVEGNCPSFVVVEGAAKSALVSEVPFALTDPKVVVSDSDVTYRMPGIGGTGVVTVSRILQMAARVAGWYSSGLDQTGLAQKGGPVISDVRITKEPQVNAPRASEHTINVVVGFDALGVVHPSVADKIDAERTVAVVSTTNTPTHDLLERRGPAFPDTADFAQLLAPITRSEHNVYLDAQRLAERICGDHMAANLLLLGAAFQAGCIPLPASALEEAIKLNGAATEQSLTAFRWGRAAVLDPAGVEAELFGRSGAFYPVEPSDSLARVLVASFLPERARDLVVQRATDLEQYQSTAYALEYVARVEEVAKRVASAGLADVLVAEYARYAYKLRAYKDEYEVARLHLDAREIARIEAAFGKGARAKVMLLPPILKSLGLKRKVSLGRATKPAFRILMAMRRLRGTKLDLFGYSGQRRAERALIAEYDALIEQALTRVGELGEDVLSEVVALPDMVRGYEEVKTSNIERFHARAAELLG